MFVGCSATSKVRSEADSRPSRLVWIRGREAAAHVDQQPVVAAEGKAERRLSG